MNHHESNAHRILGRAALATAAGAIILTAGWATPAAGEPVVPESGGSHAETDIVEIVRHRHLQVAADRAARPWAYGATWTG